MSTDLQTVLKKIPQNTIEPQVPQIPQQEEIVIDDVFDAVLNKDVKEQLKNQYFGGTYVPGALEAFGTAKGIADIYRDNDGAFGKGMGVLSYFGRSMNKADDLILGTMLEDGNFPKAVKNIFREDRDYRGKELASRIWGVPEEDMQGLGWGAVGLGIDLGTDVGIVGMSMARIGKNLMKSPNIANKATGEKMYRVGTVLDEYDRFVAKMSINAAVPGVSLWGRKMMQSLNRAFGAVSGRPMVNKKFHNTKENDTLRLLYNKDIPTKGPEGTVNSTLASNAFKDMPITKIEASKDLEPIIRNVDFHKTAKIWRPDAKKAIDNLRGHNYDKFTKEMHKTYAPKKERVLKELKEEFTEPVTKQMNEISEYMPQGKDFLKNRNIREDVSVTVDNIGKEIDSAISEYKHERFLKSVIKDHNTHTDVGDHLSTLKSFKRSIERGEITDTESFNDFYQMVNRVEPALGKKIIEKAKAFGYDDFTSYRIAASNTLSPVIYHRAIDKMKNNLTAMTRKMYEGPVKIGPKYTSTLTDKIFKDINTTEFTNTLKHIKMNNHNSTTLYDDLIKNVKKNKQKVTDENIMSALKERLEIGFNELYFGIPANSKHLDEVYKGAIKGTNLTGKKLSDSKYFYPKAGQGKSGVVTLDLLLSESITNSPRTPFGDLMLARYPELKLVKAHLEEVNDIVTKHGHPSQLFADQLRHVQYNDPAKFRKLVDEKLTREVKDVYIGTRKVPAEKRPRDFLQYKKNKITELNAEMRKAQKLTNEAGYDGLKMTQNKLLTKFRKGENLNPAETKIMNMKNADVDLLAKKNVKDMTKFEQKLYKHMKDRANEFKPKIAKYEEAIKALEKVNAETLENFRHINIYTSLNNDFKNLVELKSLGKVKPISGMSLKDRGKLTQLQNGTIKHNLDYIKGTSTPVVEDTTRKLPEIIKTKKKITNAELDLARKELAVKDVHPKDIDEIIKIKKYEAPEIVRVNGNQIEVGDMEPLNVGVYKSIKEDLSMKYGFNADIARPDLEFDKVPFESDVAKMIDNLKTSPSSKSTPGKSNISDLRELIRAQKNTRFRDTDLVEKEFKQHADNFKNKFDNKIKEYKGKKGKESASEYFNDFIKHVDNNSTLTVKKEKFLDDFLNSGIKYRNIQAKNAKEAMNSSYYKEIKKNVDRLNKNLDLDDGVKVFVNPWKDTKGQFIVGYGLDNTKAKATIKKLRKNYKKFDPKHFDDLNFSKYDNVTKYTKNLKEHELYSDYADYLDTYRKSYKELGIEIDEIDNFIPHQPVDEKALSYFRKLTPDNIAIKQTEALRNILLDKGKYGTFYTNPYSRSYMGKMEEFNNLAPRKIYEDTNLSKIVHNSGFDAAIRNKNYKDFTDLTMNDNFKISNLGIETPKDVRRIFNENDINPEFFSMVAPVKNEKGRVMSLKRFDVYREKDVAEALANKDTVLAYTNAITSMDKILKNQYDYTMYPMLKGLTTYFNTPMKSAMLTNPAWVVSNLGDSYFKGTHLLSRQLKKKLPSVAKDYHEGVMVMNKTKNRIGNTLDYFSKDIYPKVDPSYVHKSNKVSGVKELALNDKKAKAFNDWIDGNLISSENKLLEFNLPNLNADQKEKVLGDIREYMFFDTFSKDKNHIVKNLLFEESLAMASRGQVPDNIFHKIMYGTEKSWGLFLNNPVNKAMFSASGWVENITRKAQMHTYLKNADPKVLDAIRKGNRSPEVYEGLANATQSMFATHFNYTDTTRALQKLKYVVPFPTFFIKNMGFWLEAMFTNPRSLKYALKTQESFWDQEGAEQEKALGNTFPIDSKGRGAIPFNKRNLFKPSPHASQFSGIRTFNDPVGDLQNRISPLLKILTAPIRDKEQVKYRPVNNDLYQPNIRKGDPEFNPIKYAAHELNPYSRHLSSIARTPKKVHQDDARLSDFSGSLFQPRF